MQPDTKQPAKRGRPPKAAEQRRTERFEMRFTADERAKFDALGGTAWLHEQLRKAQIPASA